MKKRRLLMRLFLLVALLALAGWRAYIAYSEVRSHQELRQRVTALADQKSQLESEQLQALERGKRLQTDPGTKLDLLKERMGYSQRDEIPIVVQVEAPED
jgi:hypothetical protein